MDARKPVPDILKGVAVLLMIQVHITELFVKQGSFESIFGKISLFLGGPPAAPVFMAVMGYFLMKGESSTAKNIIRGMQLIVLGILLNVALNIHALVRIAGGSLAIDPLHLIFGVDILFLAGSSVIIIALIRPILKKHFIIPLLLACAIAALTPLFDGIRTGSDLSGHLLAFAGGNMPWSYFPLFPWLAWPLAGASYSLSESRFQLAGASGRMLALILCASLIVLIPTGFLMAPVACDLQQYYHHGILFFLWTLVFLVAWCLTFVLLTRLAGNNLLFRWLGWTGRNVTVFYVIQWIIIGNLGTWLYRSVSGWWPLGWFAVIVIVTTLGAWAWSTYRTGIRKDKLF